MQVKRQRMLGFAGLSALSLVLALVPQAATQALPASCAVSWGSGAKNAGTMTLQVLSNVRTGRHACFDRLVVDLKGKTPSGFDVRYVNRVYHDGSGKPVPLRGAADLQIVVRAPAYDARGRSTYSPANPKELSNVSNFRTFRQVAWAGSFEGQSTLGLGVRVRLPFRAFRVDDGATSRLIIDVAHHW